VVRARSFKEEWDMLRSRSTARSGAALIAATAILALTAGVALAHPESEGDHPSGCVVTAEPGSVAAGGTFTVEGNFGGASIFVLPGADASPAEDATPDWTIPESVDSFSVVFTTLGPGDITVVALVPESECGDTDHVTVTAALPNTATEAPTDAFATIAGLVLLGTALTLGRARMEVRRSSR
jgi:hypothetical protein